MATDQQPPRRHIIGYALAPKKQSSFMPSLVSLARSRGIDLIPINLTLPLTSQGPFAAIIHKLSGPAWDSALLAFSAAHPSVLIIDPPAAIARVHDRSTMLQAVSDLHHPSVTVPRQIIVLDSTALTHPPADLRFPVIAKPLTANGSDGSHKMSLVFRPDDLAHLTPPLVLQEFVNHGGVIFKIYVAGDFVCCVKRKSLPDVSKDGMGAEELTFSQISNVATDTGGSVEERYIENTEMPPIEFVNEIAHGLRWTLGLRLFNFDLIRDVKGRDRYLVIDINYFPGFCKLPSYETALTDFFCDIVNQKQHSADLVDEEGEAVCKEVENMVEV